MPAAAGRGSQCRLGTGHPAGPGGAPAAALAGQRPSRHARFTETDGPVPARATVLAAAVAGPSGARPGSGQPGEVGHLLDRVAKEVVTRVDGADELAEQLEADHAKEMRPGDQAAKDDDAGDLRCDGRR